MAVKITWRVIEGLQPAEQSYFVWDSELKGFGVAVSVNGVKSYVVKYRVGKGRGAPTRRMTICKVNIKPVDEARAIARKLIGDGVEKKDAVAQRKEQNLACTVAELAEIFHAQHVKAKRKPSTATNYKICIDKQIVPHLGRVKAKDLKRTQVARWHTELNDTPAAANKALAVLSSIYSFGQKNGYVPEDVNPARKVEKNPEQSKERYLSKVELLRLGDALRLAETTGLPWLIDMQMPPEKAKHIPIKNRTTIIDRFAVAAIRLLIFTGARLREILHLKWEYVDFERGLLLLPDSKTGKKTIVLNPPALAVLNSLPRIENCEYLISGKIKGKPRADLKRPWLIISTATKLTDMRLHDLRHTYASYGAGAGLGLPIVGKLLGHAQSATTERYAHLDNDPLKRGASIIGNEIASAMGEVMPSAEVIEFKRI